MSEEINIPSHIAILQAEREHVRRRICNIRARLGKRDWGVPLAHEQVYFTPLDAELFVLQAKYDRLDNYITAALDFFLDSQE